MLEWIITSSLLILLVLLLRRLPIAPWQRYALWLVVLVRLLVPVQLFSLPASELTLPDVGSAMEDVDLYAIPTGMLEGVSQEDVDTMLETFQPGDVIHWSSSDMNFYDQFSFSYNTGCGVIEEDGVHTYALYANLRQALLWIYGTGVLAALLVLIRSNRRFSRQLKQLRRPLEVTGSLLPVYTAEGLASPCLFGLFRPAIYLTQATAEDQTAIRHILVHEETHYRHGDHVWSLLRCLALALHWWNPLVWLAVIISRRDGELYCDAATLKRLGDEERQAYGETLLSLVTAKPGPWDLLSCSTTMTSGKRSLQERIRWIARRPKVLVSVSVAVILVALAAVGCAFGHPSEELADAISGEDIMLSEEEIRALRPDLTQDGTPDSLAVTYTKEEDLWRLTVTDGATGKQIWSEEAATNYTGWSTLFLCTLESEDYLLRYNGTMGQGQCHYWYELFWLETGGTVTKDSGQADVSIAPGGESIDQESFLAFLEKLNGYLSHSVQLMNTAGNWSAARLDPKEPQRNDLGWLTNWEGYAPEESTEENLSRYTQYLQAASQLGEQISDAYGRLSTLPFTATVEAEDGQQWTYTIRQGNSYNVEFVGNYLPVSFTWSQTEKTAWDSQQGYLLTLDNSQSGVSLSAKSGGDVVRLEEGSAICYLRAHSSDSSDPAEEQNSAIFQHLLILAEDAAGQAVWDNAVVNGSITDLEEVAAQLTEQVAQGYRDLPDFLVWKPNDVQIQENSQRVFDAWYGENPNFCFGLGIYVGISDPMSAQAFHWQVGSGLPEEPSFGDYYPWGQETYVVLDQEANLWRIQGAGTGGYAAELPFDLATATVSDLVDAWSLSEGFTHDYRLFYYLADKSLAELADLNEALDRLSREEAEAFLLGFKSHMEEYYMYHDPPLFDIASVLDAPYAALLS